MAALDFPATPAVNDIYTANGKQYKWDGTSWNSISPGNVGSSSDTQVLLNVTNTVSGSPNLIFDTGTGKLTHLGLLSMKTYSETAVAALISAGTLTLNLSSGSVFYVALNANITSISLTNFPTSGNTASFTIMFTADGTARTVTWPTSIKWSSGVAPTLTSTATKVDVFNFFSRDGGTTVYGFTSGQNL